MWCDDVQMFKIGYTTQMPGKRCGQIASKIGNPWGKQLNVRILSIILCKDEDVAKYLESFLHEIAQPARHENTEWFSMLPRSVSDLFTVGIVAVDWGYKEVLDFARSYAISMQGDIEYAYEELHKSLEISRTQQMVIDGAQDDAYRMASALLSECEREEAIARAKEIVAVIDGEEVAYE